MTAARREGDKDKSKEVLAALCKLLGNSAFGGSILDCTRFLNIIYESGFREACISVNNPRFLSLTELGDDLYEIELNRSNINMNLPMQIEFAILNYAKMYLLSFYYEFLLKDLSLAIASICSSDGNPHLNSILEIFLLISSNDF